MIRAYRQRNTLIGWIVWNVMRRVARRKARETQRKIIAAAIVAGVLAAGFFASRWEE